MKDFESTLEKRKKQLTDWIEETNPVCRIEQKHLDGGTSEQLYWHYGYMMALRDVLNIIGSNSTRH